MVTEQSFGEEVERAEHPVVVEFYASWCAICRRMAPLLDEVAAEFAPGVQLVKVDAEASPGLVSRFEVSSTPTLLVRDRGKELARMVGAQPVELLHGLFEVAAARTGGLEQDSWVPGDVCTLPSGDQPARLAEFEELFRSVQGIERADRSWLRLRLARADDVELYARELTAKESQCCSFFDFTIARDGAGLVLDVRVPADKAGVLDGLTEQARAVASV
ncbi:thioredoxin family protein [Pseudonocardia sp. RS010]|uniref:thioredoxin family protein n=1 Tax=Pseudonocardia sp. RS010 TaxID=3385979 RepID=UPI0039A20CE4